MTDIKPALLERGELAEQGPPEAVRLPIDLVDPSPGNPRRALTEVDQLADSIADPKIGLLQPIAVRRVGDRYEVIAGHRRRAAFLLLQEREPFNVAWRTIPAVVRTMGDDDAYIALISAQVQIRNWNPKEEAQALERLAETRTLDEVGKLVHRGASWVSKRLRIYNDAILSPLVQTHQLPATVAAELVIVKDPAVRKALADRAVAEGWSKDAARREVQLLRLSSQIREIGRHARLLLETLAVVQANQLPPETTRTLWTLQRRIVAIGRGTVLPTIEQAQKAAGINPDRPVKATRERRKPGYKPRTD